jgi:hypothetical protein
METEWNTLCRRDRITADAGLRLGLVLPDGPGTVVVLGPDSDDATAEPGLRRGGVQRVARADRLAVAGLGNTTP